MSCPVGIWPRIWTWRNLKELLNKRGTRALDFRIWLLYLTGFSNLTWTCHKVKLVPQQYAATLQKLVCYLSSQTFNFTRSWLFSAYWRMQMSHCNSSAGSVIFSNNHLSITSLGIITIQINSVWGLLQVLSVRGNTTAVKIFSSDCKEYVLLFQKIILSNFCQNG